jgi:hypothetical protein
MRKGMLLPLVLGIGMLLGCAGKAEPGTSVPSPAAQSASPFNPQSASAVGNVSAGSAAEFALFFDLQSEEISGESAAEDGTVLVEYSYAVPRLTVTKEDGSPVETPSTQAQRQAQTSADAFNAEFSTWLDGTNYSQLLTAAQEDYDFHMQDGYDWLSPYAEEFGYTFWRTQRLISICGTYYTSTGGVHPNMVNLGWNFDLGTGRFLHPAALGADAEGFQSAVTEEIIRQAKERAAELDMEPEVLYWTDYQDISAQWQEYAVSFTEEGMTVTFSAYEMASYAAGPQTFTMSFDFLEGYLSEDGREILGVSPPS